MTIQIMDLFYLGNIDISSNVYSIRTSAIHWNVKIKSWPHNSGKY